ncbi:MAG: hypothetical protein ACKN87_03875, partial [Microcystis aeruginosa]
MDPCLAIGYRLSRRGYGWGLIILIIVLIPAPARSAGNKHKTYLLKNKAISSIKMNQTTANHDEPWKESALLGLVGK